MSLQQIADAFRATMPKDGMVSVFRIDGLDRIGVPVVQAALIDRKGVATIGYGYGFETAEAEVGALGELCEEVHVGTWVARAPRERGSYNELVLVYGASCVCDPLTLCLPAGSDYAPDVPLSWVQARRLGDDAAVMVPREWVAAYGYQLGDEKARLITPITNGLGAGFDIPHALAHGIMELLQRDGNVISFRGLDRGIAVDLDTDIDPFVAALLARLRAIGIEPMVKLAGTDFGIPNLYVVGNDAGEPTVPIQVTACGEAAHPDRGRALRKALLEFVGSRARKAATHGPVDQVRTVLPADFADRQLAVAVVEEEEGRALAAMVEWVGLRSAELRARLACSVFAVNHRVPFSSLPDCSQAVVANSAQRLSLLASRLAAEELDILYVDCSPPDSEVKIVKTIVPGFEAETMSYGRIGWRGTRRLRARGDALLHDAPLPGAARVKLRPADEERAGGPAWFDRAAADRLVGTIYPLYRETGQFSAQLILQGRRPAA